ncbi:MAG TPA: hypothetical protein DCX06_00400, partial [Opitutae bacterium]|nr:hypothetical protein [Opitutae bacterium]
SGKSFEIFQRISGTEFLAYEIKAYETTSYNSKKLDLAGNRQARNSSIHLRVDETTLYYLSLQAPVNAIGGESVFNLDDEFTSDIHTYTNALGALNSVRVYREMPAQPATMTKEEFVAKLKDGKEWRIAYYKKATCFTCGGSGKQSKIQGGANCLGCSGQGYDYIDLIVKW